MGALRAGYRCIGILVIGRRCAQAWRFAARIGMGHWALSFDRASRYGLRTICSDFLHFPLPTSHFSLRAQRATKEIHE